MPSVFRDKIAVITGAGSGIGRALAIMLASDGCRLHLLGRSKKKLEAVASLVGEHPDRIFCHPIDLTQDGQIETFATGQLKKTDQIHLLIHCAAAISMGTMESSNISDLDRQYQTNVRAPYLLTQYMIPKLRSAQGQLVFLNSTSGRRALGGFGQYAASKFALRAIADSLREELNEDGIRVLSLYPGRTATPMQDQIHAMESREYHPERLIQPEDVASVILHALELPRTAEVTEVSVRPMQKPA